jgi:hypothetical protein
VVELPRHFAEVTQADTQERVVFHHFRPGLDRRFPLYRRGRSHGVRILAHQVERSLPCHRGNDGSNGERANRGHRPELRYGHPERPRAGLQKHDEHAEAHEPTA